MQHTSRQDERLRQSWLSSASRRGLTQDKLALRSGYTQKYISLLERAKFSPSLTALLELAAALGTSAAELVRRVEEILPRDLKRRNTQRRANSTHPNKSD